MVLIASATGKEKLPVLIVIVGDGGKKPGIVIIVKGGE